MTLDSAVNFLKENGYPTSKGKLYKLTSKKKFHISSMDINWYFLARIYSNGQKINQHDK